MTRTRVWQISALAAGVALAAWGTSRMVERVIAPPQLPPAAAAAPPPPANVPHIVATLYYASSDGRSLVALKRDVALAEGVRAQGREILISQLEPAPVPYVSLTPPGTKLRAFYVTDRGDAFVDLTSEISTGHPGGSTSELLTVQAIVNAVTTNLASVQRVQILIDGREADTLAGHIDLRRPFERQPPGAGQRASAVR